MLRYVWQKLEAVEALFAVIALGVIGLAPPVVAFLLTVTGVVRGDWRRAAVSGLVVLILGPQSIWVWEVAEKSRPLDGWFTYRIANAVLDWNPALRRVLALVWCVPCLTCAAVGIQTHRLLVQAQVAQRNVDLASAFLVPLQIAMTLGANLYLLLATAGWGGSEARLTWMHRYRFFVDLALTVVILTWAR